MLCPFCIIFANRYKPDKTQTGASLPVYAAFLKAYRYSAVTKLIKMIETLLFSVLIIAIAMALLCVKVILKKNGRFKSQHVHDNPALRKMGIHCVIDQDREAREKGKAY